MIDRGIGLDVIVERCVADVAVEGADNAPRDRTAETQRIADRDHMIGHAHRIAVAEAKGKKWRLGCDLDERDISVPILADVGENGDPEALVGLGELVARHNYARGTLLVGKAALNRGLPFDFYAYPVSGIPPYRSIGPEVEQSVIFAIARQESAFNPADVSPAQAYGLMQVTPDAARYVCKRAGVTCISP